ncbi:MAG: DNA mismatch repair endonuclease MutL [Exilispira sp.]
MIKKLPKEVWSKIQAGEVIDGPASVIRELIDNSVDAESKNINIFVDYENSYKIILEDDGKGISFDDSFLLFTNHATSKISNFDDLSNIKSLGFRGEALFSIGSVSYVEIKSKSINEEIGFELVVNGGKKIIHKKIPFSNGTKISVKNLFFNIPAREKFVQDKNKEFYNIKQIFFDKSFASYNISFTLQFGKKKLYEFCASENLENRIKDIYPDIDLNQFAFIGVEDVKKLKRELLEEFQISNIKMIFSNRSIYSKNRSIFHFSFNKRNAINENLLKRLKGYYSNYLPKGFYPYFFMEVEMNPQLIDCNVHPAKKNIKIYNENNFILSILDIINKKLDEILIKSSFYDENYIMIDKNNYKNYVFETKVDNEKNDLYEEKDISGSIDHIKYINESEYEDFVSKDFVLKDFEDYQKRINLQKIKNFIDKVKFLCQIFNTYLIFSFNDNILIIDQHAADERITYNILINNINKKRRNLLFPQIIKIDKYRNKISNDKDIENIIHLFEEAKVEIVRIGDNEFQVCSIPDIVPSYDEKNFIDQIENFINSQENLKNYSISEFVKNFYRYIVEKNACHLAIKQNDILVENDANRLLKKLLDQENFECCPHGRPTYFIIDKTNFEKVFLRKK